MPTASSPKKEISSSNSEIPAAAGADILRPTLPPNVSIFSPQDPAVSTALLESCLFTRLTISPNAKASIGTGNNDLTQVVVETLKKRPELKEDQSFWLVHQKAVLLFDSSEAGEEAGEEATKDRHHEHVRSVCLALKDGDVSLSIAGCVFDAVDAVGAGFQFDRLSGGAVLVIDLMDSDDDDDEDKDGESEDDDDDEDFDLLAGGEIII